jgi:hypothetical protein
MRRFIPLVLLLLTATPSFGRGTRAAAGSHTHKARDHKARSCGHYHKTRFSWTDHPSCGN